MDRAALFPWSCCLGDPTLSHLRPLPFPVRSLAIVKRAFQTGFTHARLPLQPSLSVCLSLQPGIFSALSKSFKWQRWSAAQRGSWRCWETTGWKGNENDDKSKSSLSLYALLGDASTRLCLESLCKAELSLYLSLSLFGNPSRPASRRQDERWWCGISHLDLVGLTAPWRSVSVPAISTPVFVTARGITRQNESWWHFMSSARTAVLGLWRVQDTEKRDVRCLRPFRYEDTCRVRT